jgi:hypothetical protein
MLLLIQVMVICSRQILLGDFPGNSLSRAPNDR